MPRILRLMRLRRISILLVLIFLLVLVVSNIARERETKLVKNVVAQQSKRNEAFNNTTRIKRDLMDDEKDEEESESEDDDSEDEDDDGISRVRFDDEEIQEMKEEDMEMEVVDTTPFSQPDAENDETTEPLFKLQSDFTEQEASSTSKLPSTEYGSSEPTAAPEHESHANFTTAADINADLHSSPTPKTKPESELDPVLEVESGANFTIAANNVSGNYTRPDPPANHTTETKFANLSSAPETNIDQQTPPTPPSKVESREVNERGISGIEIAVNETNHKINKMDVVSTTPLSRMSTEQEVTEFKSRSESEAAEQSKLPSNESVLESKPKVNISVIADSSEPNSNPNNKSEPEPPQLPKTSVIDPTLITDPSPASESELISQPHSSPADETESSEDDDEDDDGITRVKLDDEEPKEDSLEMEVLDTTSAPQIAADEEETTEPQLKSKLEIGEPVATLTSALPSPAPAIKAATPAVKTNISKHDTNSSSESETNPDPIIAFTASSETDATPSPNTKFAVHGSPAPEIKFDRDIINAAGNESDFSYKTSPAPKSDPKVKIDFHPVPTITSTTKSESYSSVTPKIRSESEPSSTPKTQTNPDIKDKEVNNQTKDTTEGFLEIVEVTLVTESTDKEIQPEGSSTEITTETSQTLVPSKKVNLMSNQSLTDNQTSTEVTPKNVTTVTVPVNTTTTVVTSTTTPKPRHLKAEDFVPEDYDKLVLPRVNCSDKVLLKNLDLKCDGVEIELYFIIRRIQQINEEEDTLTLDVDLHVRWLDYFLYSHARKMNYTNKLMTLDPAFLKTVWKPDVFLDEIAKKRRTSLVSKPLTVEYEPRGLIYYTTRLTVVLSCEMMYHYYPADTQHCDFTFRSYSYSSDELRLKWLGKRGVYLQDPTDPNFDLQVSSKSYEPNVKGVLYDRKFDHLTFTILARRKLSYHMVQTYLPSVFFVVITWLCFLIPPNMVEARIGITMTTLLTLTSMFDSVRENTPRVSYVTAIDVWMIFCVFCVFTTLLEFTALVYYRTKRGEGVNALEEAAKKQQEQNKRDGRVFFSRRSILVVHEKVTNLPDRYAFVLFFIIFAVFNVAYWSWLLVSSEYFSWKVNYTLNAKD